jgi:hypothetical protein
LVPELTPYLLLVATVASPVIAVLAWLFPRAPKMEARRLPRLPWISMILFTAVVPLFVATAYSFVWTKPALDISLRNQVSNLLQITNTMARLAILQTCSEKAKLAAVRIQNGNDTIKNAFMYPNASDDQRHWYEDAREVESIEHQCYPEDKTDFLSDPPASIIDTPVPSEPKTDNYDLIHRYRRFNFEWQRVHGYIEQLPSRAAQDMEYLAGDLAREVQNH